MFIIENKNKIKKYLPNINLYSKYLREEIGVLRTYYGKCKLYYYSNKIEKHYINISNNKTGELICSIYISPKVFKFLNLEVINNKTYFICFVSELFINNGYLNTNLRDSRMILFEK